MATESLTIKVNGDTKNFQKALKGTEAATAKLQADLSKIATIATTAFAGLGATITGLISTYRVQEQAEIKLATVLRSTAKAAGLNKEELLSMASGLQKVTTFGDEVIIGAQSLLLTFTKIGKDVFPAATETILNMSQAMGQDLKSSTIMLGKALNDPVAGISALARVGVNLSEEQKKLIKSFSDVNDVASAQKVILGELEVQFGGQARAAAEGTGRFEQLKNTLGDVAEQIGKHLVPPLAAMAKLLNEAFGTALKDKNETLGKTVAKTLLFATNLTALTAVTALTTKGFIALRTAILTAAGATKIFNKALKASVVGILLSLGAAAITEFMTDLEGNIKKAGNLFSSLTNALKVTFIQIGLLLKEGLMEVVTGIANYTIGATGTAEKNFDKFVEIAKDKFGKVKEEWEKVGLGIVETQKKTNRIIVEMGEAQTMTEQEMMTERFLQQMELRREFQEQLYEIMGEEFAQKLAITQEWDELFSEYDTEQREKLLTELSKFQLTKKELEDADLKERLKAKIKEKNDELKYEHQHKLKLVGAQKAYYKTMKFLDSNRLKEAGKFASDFNAMATSSNKELRAIAKVAANVQIVANTAAGASSAMSKSMTFFGPIAGPVIGAALAAAQIAFGVEQLHKLNAQKLADGGIVSGGISGIDSVPAMLMPGELVIPKRNAEDALNAIGATRDEEIFDMGEGGATEIIIGFDGEEASQVLTAQQIENQALGISREEVA